MAQKRARQRQLALWILVNLIIFIACYLNYRLQLKHRYLHRILNAGLCFSRAAAMVINFNLLLVWLPMCKYSLTRLACIAIGSLKHHRRRLALTARAHIEQQAVYQQQQQVMTMINPCAQREQAIDPKNESPSKPALVYAKIVASAKTAWTQVKLWFLAAKISALSSFLTAVDHCKSLHTICATTITIASVIHTVAHLINVINFSKNYDPLMSNLNMAGYKGQNPLQLLISVPGITGSLMIIILILMSLSSVDIIRNSSYDLFRIFHRLSVVFVILLFLHPSSHVLKEQSNVDRHHPELCYDRLINSTSILRVPIQALASDQLQIAGEHQGRTLVEPAASVVDDNLTRLRRDIMDNNLNATTFISSSSSDNNGIIDLNISDRNDSQGDGLAAESATTYIEEADSVDKPFELAKETNASTAITTEGPDKLCLDSMPLFVAQSSICWYVLTLGLSCYLFDLILRKWRRSKSSIELLNVRLDCEGNLIELILSNNHKRFNHWLPGQFVYLNCPQIATYEWHPFTISSMDNESGQFTLHIKTGGDWTRKLREKLEYMQISMSFFKQNLHLQQPTTTLSKQQQLQQCTTKFEATANLQLDAPQLLTTLDCCNKIGQPQIECTKLVRVKYENEREFGNDIKSADADAVRGDTTGYNCSISGGHNNNNNTGSNHNNNYDYDHDNNKELYSISHKNQRLRDITIMLESGLDLYIDGPFHSPFDRLLEQQVSVCVANGVGWTAFSSIFHCITNSLAAGVSNDSWWTQWRNFAVASNRKDHNDAKANAMAKIRQLPDTRLHLMVIVTSIEQMKPFYYLALNYFKKIQDECQIEIGDHMNPVREITAFITRSSHEDDTVKEFCEQENLSILYENHSIRVNDLFTIHFGKPKFDAYLSAFNIIYSSSKKISVYCCGSSQVKKDVREICQSLNKMDRICFSLEDRKLRPYYSYHEENF